jgi:hypothetical protein
MQWANELLMTITSIVALSAAGIGMLKWDKAIRSIAGKYKHYNDGKTNGKMRFTIKPPQFLWLFRRIGGELRSGRDTKGTWQTNVFGTSLLLQWGEATIRCSRKAPGVFEGYHVVGEDITKTVLLQKISDSWET